MNKNKRKNIFLLGMGFMLLLFPSCATRRDPAYITTITHTRNTITQQISPQRAQMILSEYLQEYMLSSGLVLVFAEGGNQLIWELELPDSSMLRFSMSEMNMDFRQQVENLTPNIPEENP
jgi:hypothetical protein